MNSYLCVCVCVCDISQSFDMYVYWRKRKHDIHNRCCFLIGAFNSCFHNRISVLSRLPLKLFSNQKSKNHMVFHFLFCDLYILTFMTLWYWFHNKCNIFSCYNSETSFIQASITIGYSEGSRCLCIFLWNSVLKESNKPVQMILKNVTVCVCFVIIRLIVWTTKLPKDDWLYNRYDQ